MYRFCKRQGTRAFVQAQFIGEAKAFFQCFDIGPGDVRRKPLNVRLEYGDRFTVIDSQTTCEQAKAETVLEKLPPQIAYRHSTERYGK